MATTERSSTSGFYRLSIRDRRAVVGEFAGLYLDELAGEMDGGGISPSLADKIVENVVGVYTLPLGIATNVRINGKDYLVPMAVEEPSVIAAASHAAKMVRRGGGFVAEADAPIMSAQVEIRDLDDAAAHCETVLRAKDEILAVANAVVSGLFHRGGGALDVQPRILTPHTMVVHVHIDCRDAMGANAVNTVAEAVGPMLAELVNGTLGLRILTNLCDRRTVRIGCGVPFDALTTATMAGENVAWAIVAASHFAELDPYRAATHNKGIMNGVDAVCMATANDWRAVEAGAHAYAARGGTYRPLSAWSVNAAEGRLDGSLEMPLALGTAGGTLRIHGMARLALKVLRIESATELAMVAASVGLASNLAALRALGTEGIQRGHMALHARSVAVAAGASHGEVDQVARAIASTKTINLAGASDALTRLRSTRSETIQR